MQYSCAGSHYMFYFLFVAALSRYDVALKMEPQFVTALVGKGNTYMDGKILIYCYYPLGLLLYYQSFAIIIMLILLGTSEQFRALECFDEALKYEQAPAYIYYNKGFFFKIF